jgi:hypothetical protein
MAEQNEQIPQFITQRDQPLIGIITKEDGREVVRYFTEEKQKQTDSIISVRGIQKALKLAGSWSDLDWDEVEQELYRIRHESQPTPPISI